MRCGTDGHIDEAAESTEQRSWRGSLLAVNRRSDAKPLLRQLHWLTGEALLVNVRQACDCTKF